MKKFLKITGSILAALVLLSILLLVCLMTFVNPNRFKPFIAEKVKQSTGRQLTIEGDLSWSVFPYLGIKAEHLTLGNPEGFKQNEFIDISKMTISVKLLPLLHKKIQSDGIMLDGVKLTFIKNAKGDVNWAMPVVAHEPNKTDVSSNNTEKAAMGLLINAIDIKNADIIYRDEQKNKITQVEHFTLQAKHINVLNPFPIATEFDFSGTNPNQAGHVKLTSDVIVDLNQNSVQWSNFKGALANLTLTGKISMTDLDKSPQVLGQLTIEPFDLKQLLKSMGQSVDNIQTLKQASGDMELHATTDLLSVRGVLKIETVEVNKIKLTNLVVPFNFQDNTLMSNNLSGDFYQGTLQSDVNMNFKNVNPAISVNGKLARFQIGDLLSDLNGKKRKISLVGAGNVDFDMVMAGSNAAAINNSLNGTCHLAVADGVLKGVDIAYLIDKARSFAKLQGGTVANNNETAFTRLTATGVFRHGVISNNDLVLQTAVTQSNGSGTINLPNQRIDYHLLTTITKTSGQKDDANNLYGMAIPIDIVGSLSDPHIGVNPDAIIKAIAEFQLKRAQSNVSDHLKDVLKKKAVSNDLLNNLLGH